MDKAKEISALWSEIKPQIGEMVRLCHEVESHYEVTADAYQRGYKAGREAEKVRQPDLEQARKEAYEQGYYIGYSKYLNKSYEDGLKDAWETARTLWNTPNRKEIFGYTVFNTALMALTAQEAIEKIRQYEQEKEEQIQVGDEVIRHYKNEFMEGDDAPSIFLSEEDGHFRCLAFNGRSIMIAEYPKNQYRKTGRHFPEIAEVMQKMMEADNG